MCNLENAVLLTLALAALGHGPDERLVEAFRWRDLVQVRISVNHHGYVAYYQLAAGGQWQLLCRTGYWIA